jgi:ELWxxDGT repeat protein
VGGTPYFVRQYDKIARSAGIVNTSYSVNSPAGSIWQGDETAESLTAVNGVLYFTSKGLLYKGSEPVKSSQAGTANASPSQLTNVNNRLYFAANGGLWKSDGTATGTIPVKNGIIATHLAGVNGTLYFSGDDGTRDVLPEYSPNGELIGHGQELWKSDGSLLGTVRVKEVNPDYKVRCVNDFTGLEVDCDYPGAMYVFEPLGSDPARLTDVNGTLFFTAVHNGSGGESLWKSDGTEGGTVKLKDVVARRLINVNGTLFFAGKEGTSPGLYLSNGTPEGTVLIKEGIEPTSLTNFNNTLYFAANGSLWKSNGTKAGTSVVKSGIAPLNLVRVNNTLFFTATESTAGRELYKSDGTAAGTLRVKDIAMGTGSSAPAHLTPVNGLLYFTASNGTSRGLYKSDGTQAGTVLVKGGMNPSGLTNVDGIVCFFTSQGLWRSDGTSLGTQLVKSGVPATQTRVMDGVLYFAYDNGYYGEELWKYDPLRCSIPTVSLTVEGSTVCSNSNARVLVKAAQAGVYYQLYYGNSPIGKAHKSSGGDLVLSVPATQLSVGTNTFTVKALGCREVALTQKATITVLPTLTPPWVPATTIASGQTATLTASGAPQGVTYRWYSAASGGSPVFTGVSYTTPVLTTTTSYYVASFLVTCSESSRTKVTVTVSPAGGATAFRVNAGGNAFSTIDRRNFLADGYFSGGVVSSTITQEIMGTADDYLYQTGRHGSSFSYNFPTGNGSYDVVLHFAETYYGNTAPGGVGSRKFHVNMEGVRKLTDYDVFARAGGPLRVAQETFSVTVDDGTLNVAFLKGTANNPAVKAIEVLPAGSALALNSGGAAFTTTAGKQFYPDSYYAYGRVSSISSGDIVNTTDDELYRNARVGVFSYGLPSGNGTFDVVLHFAETYWGSRASGGIGSRKFNLYVENVKRLSDYDIFAKAGGAMRAVKETIRVTVTDGVLNLYFAKGAADNPAVSAIDVIPVMVAARVSSESKDAEDWHVSLYPNPVTDQLTIGLPFPADAVNATTVTDAAGRVQLINAHRVSGESQMQIEVGQLSKGLHLLEMDTQEGYKVLKFVKQ